MQIHKNEITTGLLVLTTAGILLAVIILIGMPGVLHPLNTYRIYFDNAEGIRSGAPVLLAGREIGKVSRLESPVPVANRPPGHRDYEVSIDVQVNRDAGVRSSIKVYLKQQGLLGQEVIDFVGGDEGSELAPNHTEFLGERVPDVSEAMANSLKRLTGDGSDLAMTLKNVRIFSENLNNPGISKVITNFQQMTDTLKREPWRLLWPSTKKYPGDAIPVDIKRN